MISFSKTYPQIIVCEKKHGNEYYVVNSDDDILDTSLKILEEWIQYDYISHLKDQEMPEIDLLNSDKAKLKPWLYSPSSKFDEILLAINAVKSYENGVTPDILKPLFEHDEKVKEKCDNVIFWKKYIMKIINKFGAYEYMSVYMEAPKKIR